MTKQQEVPSRLKTLYCGLILYKLDSVEDFGRTITWHSLELLGIVAFTSMPTIQITNPVLILVKS